MTTAIKEETILEQLDWQIVLVHAHLRARPGEGGSDFKPVNVKEHFRQVWKDGSQKRLSWRCEPAELSSELVEAMAEVQGILGKGMPKKHLWKLKEAQAFLTYGMRYSYRRGWGWQGKHGIYEIDVWFADPMLCVDYMIKRGIIK